MEDEGKKLAQKAFLITKELVRPTDFVYISLFELPQEVAAQRWPEDFKSLQSLNQQ